MRERTLLFTNNTMRDNREKQTLPYFTTDIRINPTSHHSTLSRPPTTSAKSHDQNPAFHTTNKAFVHRILPLSPKSQLAAIFLRRLSNLRVPTRDSSDSQKSLLTSTKPQQCLPSAKPAARRHPRYSSLPLRLPPAQNSPTGCSPNIQ